MHGVGSLLLFQIQSTHGMHVLDCLDADNAWSKLFYASHGACTLSFFVGKVSPSVQKIKKNTHCTRQILLLLDKKGPIEVAARKSMEIDQPSSSFGMHMISTNCRTLLTSHAVYWSRPLARDLQKNLHATGTVLSHTETKQSNNAL